MPASNTLPSMSRASSLGVSANYPVPSCITFTSKSGRDNKPGGKTIRLISTYLPQDELFTFSDGSHPVANFHTNCYGPKLSGLYCNLLPFKYDVSSHYADTRNLKGLKTEHGKTKIYRHFCIPFQKPDNCGEECHHVTSGEAAAIMFDWKGSVKDGSCMYGQGTYVQRFNLHTPGYGQRNTGSNSYMVLQTHLPDGTPELKVSSNADKFAQSEHLKAYIAKGSPHNNSYAVIRPPASIHAVLYPQYHWERTVETSHDNACKDDSSSQRSSASTATASKQGVMQTFVTKMLALLDAASTDDLKKSMLTNLLAIRGSYVRSWKECGGEAVPALDLGKRLDGDHDYFVMMNLYCSDLICHAEFAGLEFLNKEPRFLKSLDNIFKASVQEADRKEEQWGAFLFRLISSKGPSVEYLVALKKIFINLSNLNISLGDEVKAKLLSYSIPEHWKRNAGVFGLDYAKRASGDARVVVANKVLCKYDTRVERGRMIQQKSAVQNGGGNVVKNNYSKAASPLWCGR